MIRQLFRPDVPKLSRMSLRQTYIPCTFRVLYGTSRLPIQICYTLWKIDMLSHSGTLLKQLSELKRLHLALDSLNAELFVFRPLFRFGKDLNTKPV